MASDIEMEIASLYHEENEAEDHESDSTTSGDDDDACDDTDSGSSIQRSVQRPPDSRGRTRQHGWLEKHADPRWQNRLLSMLFVGFDYQSPPLPFLERLDVVAPEERQRTLDGTFVVCVCKAGISSIVSCKGH